MTKYDKMLIVLILILSFIGIYIGKQYIPNEDEKYISIEVDGKSYKNITVDENMKKTMEIKTKYGYNKIQIKGKSVRVVKTDCPDKIDVKQGYISNTGETIVCLPNRVLIEIKGKEVNNVDYISQ